MPSLTNVHQKTFPYCNLFVVQGAHLTLRDERWALAVESCIKKFGWAFCCHDNHDQQVLKQLFTQVCRDNIPTIIVSRFQVCSLFFEITCRFCRFLTVQHIKVQQLTLSTSATLWQNKRQVNTGLYEFLKGFLPVGTKHPGCCSEPRWPLAEV